MEVYGIIIFLISLAVLIYVSRYGLWQSLLVSTAILGIFTLNIDTFLKVVMDTITDTSIIFLTLSVALIPVMGSMMDHSGIMESMVNNTSMKKKNFVIFSPGILGLLIMPGGALLSAPLIESGGKGIEANSKAAINVWFRHVFIVIYPLGALLATTKMAGLDLYNEILYIFPFFLAMFVSGYVFLLGGIKGNVNKNEKRNAFKVAIPVFILLLAPLIHFILISIFPDAMSEFFLFIAVVAALITAIIYSMHTERYPAIEISRSAVRIKPWNFGLIIIGMFLFLNTFTSGDVPSSISKIPMNITVFLVLLSFLLGIATGRVQVPVSILLPIYFSEYSASIPPLNFAIMFFSAFMGYVISPVHPCLNVSLEYFKTNYISVIRIMAIPTLISVIFAVIISVMFA